VIVYCLDAEGITLDDVDLIVRNCYILPIDRRAAGRDLQRRRRHGDGERAAGVN